MGYVGDFEDANSVKFNPDEVARVLMIPLRDLAVPTHMEHFRGSGIDIPSWKINNYHIWGIMN